MRAFPPAFQVTNSRSLKKKQSKNKQQPCCLIPRSTDLHPPTLEVDDLPHPELTIASTRPPAHLVDLSVNMPFGTLSKMRSLALAIAGVATVLLLGIPSGGPSPSSSSSPFAAAAAASLPAPPPPGAAPAPAPAAPSSPDVDHGGGGGGGGGVVVVVVVAVDAPDYGSRIMRWKLWSRERHGRAGGGAGGERRRGGGSRGGGGGGGGGARGLVAELERQSPIYATMRRSQGEKRRLAMQRRDAAARLPPAGPPGERRRRERAGAGGSPPSSSHSFPVLPSSSHSFFPPSSSSSSPSSPSPPPRPPPHLLLRLALTPGRRRRRPRRRRLEDEFADAYSTGRPGSTYGYSMFCGISWAEASTSCPSRQNCPSGQSDECITPGHECWAFTECDTRNGEDGALFSEAHGVTGAENLAAVGVGAVASGGFVDLDKPSYDETDHYFCGVGYEDAVSRCESHCPSGNLNDCPPGEICFTKTPCDARMLTKGPQPPSPTMEPTTPSPVVLSSKLNKYFCGYDWEDAQLR